MSRIRNTIKITIKRDVTMRETGAKCYIIVILTGLAFCLVSSVFDTFSMPRGVAEFRVMRSQHVSPRVFDLSIILVMFISVYSNVSISC